MRSMVHTLNKVMEMHSHLLGEAAFTFDEKKRFFHLREFFPNGAAEDLRCVLARWKTSVKDDPNQSWQSDMLQVAFLAHVNKQCCVVLKQC